jgi:hypothetical protein
MGNPPPQAAPFGAKMAEGAKPGRRCHRTRDLLTAAGPV